MHHLYDPGCFVIVITFSTTPTDVGRGRKCDDSSFYQYRSNIRIDVAVARTFRFVETVIPEIILHYRRKIVTLAQFTPSKVQMQIVRST